MEISRQLHNLNEARHTCTAAGSVAGPHTMAGTYFTGTPFRAKIEAYLMRSPSAIPVRETPLLKRFRRRRPDRGRRPSR